MDVLIPVASMINSVSYSKLTDFEQCPRRAKMKHIDKIAEKKAPAAERGTEIHQKAEDFVRGLIQDMPHELLKFETEFNILQREFPKGNVSLEGEWGFDKDWYPTEYKTAWLRMKADGVFFKTIRHAVVIDYKGLATTTKLPTPSGWTTMGEVQVGDTLFSQNGNTCKVVGKSKIKNLPCYKITFDDTTSIICDNEHLWATDDGRVVVTPALTSTDYIAVCNTIDLPEQELPIHPYVLGFWIADGKHTSGEISKPDEFVWQEVQRLGYQISHDYSEKAQDGKCRVHTVMGLRTQLRELNLLGNKHIPQIYMRASKRQRLELLQGLMDGDGSVNPLRKQVVLQSVDPDLSNQYLELIHSLGQRATRAFVGVTGFGKYAVAYPISFRPNNINPFKLPRKADACKDFGPGRSARRRVKSVVLIDSVQTQCISVDSDDHTFLCTERFLPTHNTGRSWGNELKHSEQVLLYAIATFILWPELEEVEVELWYLDQNEILSKTYTREQALRMLQMFERRMKKVTSATEFPANPTVITCKWCPFGPSKGGQCEEGVAEGYDPIKLYRQKFG